MIKSYINKEGWIYDLQPDETFLSRQMTNVIWEEDGSFVITSWYPLVYTKEDAEKYLKPLDSRVS